MSLPSDSEQVAEVYFKMSGSIARRRRPPVHKMLVFPIWEFCCSWVTRELWGSTFAETVRRIPLVALCSLGGILCLIGWLSIWLSGKLVDVVEWLLGLDFDEIDKKPASIVRDVATIYGLILTLGVTLAITLQQGVTKKGTILALYVLISFVTIGSLVVILRTKGSDPPSPPKPAHAFDRGTLMFTRYTVAASILLSLTLFGCAFSDLLPGQGFDVAKPVEKFGTAETLPYKEQPGEGILVPFELTPKMYENGVPSKVILVVTLDESIGKQWKVEEVRGFIGHPNELKPMPTRPSIHNQDKEKGLTSSWMLRDLDSKATYTLKIHLAPRDPKDKKLDAKGVREKIDARKGLTAVFYTQQK